MELTHIPVLVPGTLSNGPTMLSLHQEPSGQLKIVYTDEREILVDGGTKYLAGNLDRVTLLGEDLVVEGWAADLEKNQPAEEVFIFGGGQLVARTALGVSRQDVAEAHQEKALVYSGFSIKIPQKVLKLYSSSINLIVVSQNDQARELPFSPQQKDFMRSTLEEDLFSQ